MYNKQSTSGQIADTRVCLVVLEKKLTYISSYIKESSPIKRIMNRNYEKQAELFNERLNETASLASRKPQKKQKLTRLNSLTGRARGSLSSRKSVSGITGNFSEVKTSLSDLNP